MKLPVEHSECTGGGDLGSAPVYDALWFESASRAEEKNQDRARAEPEGSAWFATLCDGVTQSMHSVVAAEIISNDPPAIWANGALGARIQLLRDRREELIATSPAPVVDETSFLSRTFAQLYRDRQQQAFQTTFVSARVTSLTDGSVLLTARLCGDSALLVFDERGRLLLSRREIEDEGSPFLHGSPVTQVLPDHEHALTTVEEKFTRPVHVILCSDGFYDAFANPSALLRWLLLNSGALHGSDRDSRFAELHDQLGRTRGDDDMSVVWIYPRAGEQSPVAIPAEVQPASGWRAALARLRSIGRRLTSGFGLIPTAPERGQSSTED